MSIKDKPGPAKAVELDDSALDQVQGGIAGSVSPNSGRTADVAGSAQPNSGIISSVAGSVSPNGGKTSPK